MVEVEIDRLIYRGDGIASCLTIDHLLNYDHHLTASYVNRGLNLRKVINDDNRSILSMILNRWPIEELIAMLDECRIKLNKREFSILMIKYYHRIMKLTRPSSLSDVNLLLVDIFVRVSNPDLHFQYNGLAILEACQAKCDQLDRVNN